MLTHFHQRIARKSACESEAPLLLIPFGDSVTQGCMECGVIDHAGVYHNLLKRMLEVEYPACVFSVLNAGVSGEGAGNGLQRLQRDVTGRAPDLVILGFCLNDATKGLALLDAYEHDIRAIIGEIRAKTDADIIILTPNFMASHLNPKIHESHMRFAQGIIAAQNDGVLEAYAKRLRRIASELGILVADVYAKWEAMRDAGIDTTERLVNGLNHPDAEGQAMIAETAFALIKENKTSNLRG